jgi:ferredoxin
MKVIVDWDLCEAHAECVAVAPEIFDIGDDEQVTLLQEEAGEELRDKAEQAVKVCPVAAISLEG